MAIITAEAQDGQPGVGNNAAAVNVRATKQGELVTVPFGKAAYGPCGEGSYFHASNATPGTGVAGIAAANGYDATEALLHVINDATAAAGTRIFLDYLKLSVTAAGTNGTDVSYAMHLDTGTDRNSSGGSAITEVNTNMNSTQTSDATIQFGAVVTAAASGSVRKLGSGELRSVITVVGDTFWFDFGTDHSQVGSGIINGTVALTTVTRCPPVVLGPTDQFILAVNAASQSAASSFEFELGYWER